MYKSKKAVVTLTSFSLVIIASVLILSFSYFFYDLNKQKANEYNSRIELIQSSNLLRSELISLLRYSNSTLNYSNRIDPVDINFLLYNNVIYATKNTKSRVIAVNTTTLGFEFCSSYNYNPRTIGIFTFNGSCISLI